MNRRGALVAAACAALLILSTPVGAQTTLRTTPVPQVTAENEAWYLRGEAISFNGSIYYPAGAITHFNRNEMVPAGVFGNTLIYVRTAQEPGSIIYVPLAGGVMRPYERRRSGDLAGTSGSMAPSFPISMTAAEANQPVGAMRAAAPPTGFAVAVTATSVPTPVGLTGVVPAPGAPAPPPAAAAPAQVGTSGVAAMAPAPPPRMRVETARPPTGLNDVYLEFQGTRWFLSGPAVEYSPGRFKAIGDHRGFAVFTDAARPDVIYVSLIPGSPGLLTPYKSR